MEKQRKRKSFVSKIAPYIFYLPSIFVGPLVSKFISIEYGKNKIENYAKVPFKDTDKPNAIVILPKKDKDGAFFRKQNRNFLEKITSAYDVNFEVISDERELYSAIDKTPNVELLVIGGHGDGWSIGFDNRDKESNKIKDKLNKIDDQSKDLKNYEDKLFKELSEVREKGYLSSDDSELKKYLPKLSKNATIFLASCQAGKYGLVDKIKEFARQDITVLGGTDSYGPSQIKVKSLKPFKISIEDMVYTTEDGNKSPDGVYVK